MKTMLAAIAALGLALMLSMGTAGTAEAKHKCGHKGRICKPVTTTKVKCQKAVVTATEWATGAFGVGTKKAQAKARTSWEIAASLKYGAAYGHWGNALGAHFACKHNLAKATCTAIAKPCKG